MTFKCEVYLWVLESFHGFNPRCNGRLLGRLVAADLPGKIQCSRSCAHAQNNINNGNLPGKSAAT